MPSQHARILAQTGGIPLLVTNPVNIHYLTGMDISSGYVLVSKSGILLCTDARYLERAQSAAACSVCDHAGFKRRFQRLQGCMFEADHLTVEALGGWKKEYKTVTWKRSSGIVARLRRAKTPDELKKIRRAMQMTRTILRRIPTVLKTGIAERDVAWLLQEWAHQEGADGMAFPPIVGFGSHTARPHHAPTSRTLKKGHVVQIDVGVRYQGYCSDYSEVFFMQPPTGKQLKAWEAVKQAKRAAMEAVKPGVSVRELDRIARDVLKRYGFNDAFTHALGHGLGLEIHEGTVISSRAKQNDTLLQDEVVTIEPGVYFPGAFGIRLEETVIVS